MTQNARLALYVPTGADADPGEIIEIRGTAALGQPIPTRFSPQAGAVGGIGEAPLDGEFYARRNADWEVTIGASPEDGQMYARQGDGWAVSPPFPEAPADGKQYARSNANWVVVTSMPAVIDGGTF